MSKQTLPVLFLCLIAGCNGDNTRASDSVTEDAPPQSSQVVNHPEPAPQLTPSQEFENLLAELGLPTNVQYPYWPLVYSNIQNNTTMTRTMSASGHEYMGASRLITIDVTNYGNKPVENVFLTVDLGSSLKQIKSGSVYDWTDNVAPGVMWRSSITDNKLPGFDIINVHIRGEGITGDPRY